MRRNASREKQLIALIEEALSCRSFCSNNPAWVENALRLIGSECSPQTVNEKCGIFEIEFSFKGWQVELWKHPSRGFSYRRTMAEGVMRTENKWKNCVDTFPTAKAAADAAKAEIQYGEA